MPRKQGAARKKGVGVGLGLPETSANEPGTVAGELPVEPAAPPLLRVVRAVELGDVVLYRAAAGACVPAVVAEVYADDVVDLVALHSPRWSHGTPGASSTFFGRIARSRAPGEVNVWERRDQL